jgi:hypothetical protein
MPSSSGAPQFLQNFAIMHILSLFSPFRRHAPAQISYEKAIFAIFKI